MSQIISSGFGSGGVITAVNGTANQITASTVAGVVTLSTPLVFIAPGSIASTTTITAATGLTVIAGGATITLGDVTLTSGNIEMAYTNAAGTEGLIKAGGVPLVSTLGTGNSFFGVNVANLTFNTGVATNNTICGAISFQAATTAVNNSALGYGVLSSCTSGGNNVAIGLLAGSNITTSSNNIFISNTGVLADSGKIRIGALGTHTSTFIQGIASVVVANKEYVTIDTTTGELGSDAGPSGGITWSVETIDGTIAVNTGVIANKAGLLTMTLPAVAAVGDIFEITGINTAVGWRIAQGAGQTIYYGTSATTTGGAGYLEATNIRDSIRFVCVVANLDFNVLSSVGNITVA